MKQALGLLKTMRPKQWTKNMFLFAALIFDGKLADPRHVLSSCIGFVLFCLVSGAVYTLNDVSDLEQDKQHPKKRTRPLPAGELSPRLAVIAALSIAAGSLAAAWALDRSFALILGGYLALQALYLLWLKRVVLLDVMIIATGFVLRVAGGVVLVNAARFSPWLYICMTLLALFLALGKRRGELLLLKDNAGNHRESLGSYTVPFLDHLLSIITASTIVAYALYTFSAPNLPENHLMMLTIPFVIYALFRYLYLIHIEGITQAPDEVLLTDRAFQVALLLWALTSAGIMYLC